LRKAREAKQGMWEAQVKKKIAEVSKVTDAHPELPALEKAAKAAMTRSLDEWVAKAGEGWRKWAQQMPEQPAEIFDQMLAQVDQTVQSDWFGDYRRPFEQPQWEDGLRAALTAEQHAAWQRAEAQRRAEVQKELAGSFRATVERRKTQLQSALESKGTSIISTLSLPPDRAKKLTALAGTIAEAASERWRARTERALLWMDDDLRRQAVKSGNFYIRPDENETKAQDAAWEEGVAKILTPEETQRLRTTQAEYKERRQNAVAQILLSHLDEAVAFTTAQRTRLWPIVEREVRAGAALLPDTDEGYYHVDLRNVFARARQVKTEELEAILDATQRQRWTDACNGRTPSSTGFGAMARFAVARTSAPAEPARVGEPEDVENVISDHLHEQATAERRRLLALHLLQAEDAARVAGLPEPAASRLRTAARGAAEEELATWKSSNEQNIRSQLRDVTPANVKQRIAGMGFSSSRRNTTRTDPGYWEAAVKAELNEAQLAAWKKEVAARAEYRDKAIASLILAEFDRRVALTAAQWDQLAPRVSAMLTEYAPDIASMFSFSGGYTWYLASHSMFLPIAAVPEKELKELLTGAQWERWSTGGEFGNVKSYWENIQRIHTNRVREKKQ
jgi:hypothetical protein